MSKTVKEEIVQGLMFAFSAALKDHKNYGTQLAPILKILISVDSEAAMPITDTIALLGTHDQMIADGTIKREAE